jgi:hypothetical protein
MVKDENPVEKAESNGGAESLDLTPSPAASSVESEKSGTANNYTHLEIGSLDAYGNKILRIFHDLPEKYVIFETDKLEINIQGDTSALVGKIKIHELMAKISDYRVNVPSIRKRYNSPQAHALRLALDGDDNGCERALQGILESIPRYLTRRSQLTYVLGSVILLFAALVLYGVSWKFGLINAFGVRIYTSIVFAAMGGVMSVAIGLRKLELDLHESLEVNAFYGALRVFIAMIAGVIMLFLIESKIALSFLQDPAASPNGYSIAAFLSGFSEMLVPNLMKKMDEKAAE